MTDSNRGRPVWFELVTEDRDAAGRFYAAVAGWTIQNDPDPSHGGYQIAVATDGEGAAGLMTPLPGMTVPDGWRLYFGSDDVDADAARIVELGGQVTFGPMDIPGVGRFLVATDPQGVAFNLLRDTRGAPAAFCHGEDSRPGHGVWVELATPDPDAAIAFYGALFGWAKQGGMPMGDMGEYSFVGWAERDCPGAVMSSSATGAAERWSWYVSVPDVDAAVDAAKGGGGTLIQGPDEIPGGQFSVNLADTQGHGFGLVGPRPAPGDAA